MDFFGKRKTTGPGPTPAAASWGSAGPGPVAGPTDLHIIAARGTAEDVRTCIASGADVNEPNRVGYTPLGIAATRGDVEVARALLEAGAAVDSADKTGTTALVAAVLNSKGHGEMITLLLNHGADPAKPNSRGQSPIQLACRMTPTDVASVFDRH